MLNNPSNLNKIEWLNLVFKNRNQSYGAYELRLHANQNTLRALFIAVPLFTMLFVAPMLYKHFNPVQADVLKPDTMIDLIELPVPVVEKIKPQEKQELPKAEPIKEKVKMIALPNKPVVVEDAALIDPPTIKDIEVAVIGPVTQEGLENRLIAVPSQGEGGGLSGGNGTGDGTATDNEIHNVTTIEVYPEFVGGMKAWTKFIQKNLRYPPMAMDQGKQGKVFISFVVEKDGSVSNVTVVKGIGYGCDEEAMRVISKSPKWKPGKQNGQNVRVKYTIPLGFAINPG